MCGFTTDLLNVEALTAEDRKRLNDHLQGKRAALEVELADVDRALNKVRSSGLWEKKSKAA